MKRNYFGLVAVFNVLVFYSLFAFGIDGNTNVHEPITQINYDDIDDSVYFRVYVRQNTMKFGCTDYKIDMSGPGSKEALSAALTSYVSGKNAHIAVGKIPGSCIIYRIIVE